MGDTITSDEMEALAATLLPEFLDEFVAMCDKSKYVHSWWSIKPSELETGRRILSQDRRVQAILVRQAMTYSAALVRAQAENVFTPTYSWHTLTGEQRASIDYARYRIHAATTLASALCRRTLPFTADDIRAVCLALASDSHDHYGIILSSHAVFKAFRPALQDAEILAHCRPALERMRERVRKLYVSAAQRDFLRTLDDLLAGGERDELEMIHADEWGDQARPLLEAMESETRQRWQTLLRHCATARGATPSEKWLRAGREARAALDDAEFAQGASALLEAFRKSSNKPPASGMSAEPSLDMGSILDERNADLLRGLVWLCANVEDARLAAALGDGVIAGYRKITGRGPRCVRVASACVYALQRAPRLSGAAHLERARMNVKQPQYTRSIERALDDAAKAAGLAREDLEEMTIPTFDLRDGRVSVVIGSATAELEVCGSRVALQWRDAHGVPRKAEPAEIKREHKGELKDLKRLRDDLARMLAAQSARLERLPLTERRWPLAVWRERYLDHPLVGSLARRLIWRLEFQGGHVDGAWLDGALVSADDQPLKLPDDAEVTTWHPVFATAAETLAWREWLMRHTITQPFKQAHREVYLLTDAERTTRVYSNRFAGHILRQHQFNALCEARGWRNQLRLMVDDEYPPAILELPRWNLRAEYWIEGAGDQYEVDTNATGTYWRVSTDQVRFHQLRAPRHFAHAGGGGYYEEHAWRQGRVAEPIPLEEIPPLVLSEVMRDVDLFVGVASVGADPTWQDGGPQARYRTYWYSYSFGELSASAELRRQLIERLLPGLAIADRCRLDGRFLRVRGELREYKIHLGSGNILMEPNDQYLCIVPSRGDSGPANIYLPFEGDNALAIILSKAFLLAADTKITDPTITRQIGAA